MKTAPYFVAGALLVSAAVPAFADEPIPDNAPRMTSPGPYDDFIKQVQEKLNALGFDAGPVNGDFSAKTQAALAQFQLANLLPASGMPDAATLYELGIPPSQSALQASALSAPEANAAAGSSR